MSDYTTEQDNLIADLQEKWMDRGREAGKKDGWMTPCVEEVEGYDKKEDVDVVQDDHDNWEETNHFQELYRKPMTNDIDELLGFEGEDYIDVIQTLITAFWEGYDETSDIYKKVKKERKIRKKLKVKI